MRRAHWPLILACVLWAGAAARDGAEAWVAATVLPPLVPQTSVQVLDRDGDLLRAYTVADGRWRLPLSAAEADPRFLAMLLAFEDRRFPDHAGVDPLALVRAVVQAAWNGQVVSGGSTLTMQVARLLEESGTGRLSGKLRQMRVALALEQRLTKDQILTLYLQLAPYGGNVEGLRAASLAYFSKEPRRLTPAEAALLVALPQSPEARRPDRHPEAAALSRDRVLARAVAAGILTAEDAQAARHEVVPTARRPVPALAPHLSDRAVAGAPERLTHRLTIDRTLQVALERLAADTVAAQGERLQAAIVVVDHASGEILASVGSAGFRADARQGFVDMTQALRSPGSALKPLVYGLAFDEGFGHPETMVEDRPTRFGTYAPQNFDRQYRGTVRMREALQLSLNIPVVSLTEAMGPARLLVALDRAGVRYALPEGAHGLAPGLAIALGGIGVNLQDMVQLYAAIARGGTALPLRWRMEGGAATGARVLGETSAWQVADILSGLAPPPGAPANRLAYKTGTSYGHRDAWAIGFDGRHVVGVWLGRADGTPVPGAFGADLAAPVLFQAFARLKPALDPQPPAPPATLLVANAQLPANLQRFRSRVAAFGPAPDAPRLAFPPDGAQVEPLPQGVKVKVDGGAPPFTWMADGVPILTGQPARDAMLPLAGKGFVTLSVIDSEGRSSRSVIRIR